MKPSLLPDSLEDFINLVVPELQKRGVFGEGRFGSGAR